jgi:peptidoglycan L-alanyl-D-glutamate endopeptidase CwlK
MLLRIGNEGIDVANWQRFLISKGYKIEADGDFGPNTEKATRAWQSANGLSSDGIVGPDSYKKALEVGPKTLASPVPKKIVTTRPALIELSRVHPVLAQRAQGILDLAASEGYGLIVTQGLRTFAEQDALFSKGRRGIKGERKVTNARGGQSYHNFGLATDFAFLVNGKISWDEKLYKNIGRWAEAVGLEWGGNWKFVDLPHVQLKNLPSYKVLLPIYQQGGLKAVWEKYKG